MDPIAVTAALLRAQLPEVPIREGASMMARVASRGSTHAVIVIAGLPITAKLPPEIEAGTVLKLKVKEVTAERVWMQIEPQTTTQSQTVGQAAPPPQPQPPRVEVEEPPTRQIGADGEPADVVSLSFTSPTLGKLDLRLELRGERLLAEVTTPAGRPHQVASRSSERLRANLEAVGLEATVNVRPRHTPLDLYA
jgi:hypothetical protein